MQEITLKNLAKDYRSNEAYKTLRTNIEFSGSDKQVIVFTRRSGCCSLMRISGNR